jgi:hypothetical protein
MSAPNYAQRVRDGLDKIDGASFGTVDKLLNQITEDADCALKERAQLIEALKIARYWMPKSVDSEMPLTTSFLAKVEAALELAGAE